MNLRPRILAAPYPTKAVGPNHHVIGAMDGALIAAAVAEIGPAAGWPASCRDRHHILEQGRSLILRDHRHRDTPQRGRYPSLETIIARVLSLGYGTVPGKIVVAFLPPGKVIKPHRDSGEYYTFHNRVHVPLLTDPGVVMSVDGEDYHMAVGQVYLFQNRRRHAARNLSPMGRLHLIVDVLDPRYSAAFFRRMHLLLATNFLWAATLYRLLCHRTAAKVNGKS